ncbi:hypothetical protein [Xanthocytophaga agilis]|uniref:YcxB-like protein domain-containing protein n=1 Tax=Xanthocytophaga agilis TaxID=3048010 RepID=A0AAE3UFN4_9BACT|nr:hypothetical protein [Xanthocytophaga agilis]MDJ1504043.1 hypothetical protein [Xanthocytophaga agilis]
MKRYTLLLTYKATYFIQLFLTILLSMPLVVVVLALLRFLFKLDEWVAIGIYTLVVFAILKYTKSWIHRKAEISLDSHEMTIQMEKYLFFSEKIVTFRWEELAEYKYQNDQYFELFKLKFKNGKTLTLTRETGEKDDFAHFLKKFKKLIAAHTNYFPEREPIRAQKTFYETRAGLVSAFVLAFILLAIPITSCFTQRWPAIGNMLILYSGSFAFIHRVYTARS